MTKITATLLLAISLPVMASPPSTNPTTQAATQPSLKWFSVSGMDKGGTRHEYVTQAAYKGEAVKSASDQALSRVQARELTKAEVAKMKKDESEAKLLDVTHKIKRGMTLEDAIAILGDAESLADHGIEGRTAIWRAYVTVGGFQGGVNTAGASSKTSKILAREVKAHADASGKITDFSDSDTN